MKTSTILWIILGAIVVYFVGKRLGWWGNNSSRMASKCCIERDSLGNCIKLVWGSPDPSGNCGGGASRNAPKESPNNLTIVNTKPSVENGFNYIPVAAGFIRVPRSAKNRTIQYNGQAFFVPASVTSSTEFPDSGFHGVVANYNPVTGVYTMPNGKEAIKCCDKRDAFCHCTSWHWAASSDCGDVPCGGSTGIYAPMNNIFSALKAPFVAPKGAPIGGAIK